MARYYPLLLVLVSSLVSSNESEDLELPTVGGIRCENNAIVASWCDDSVNPDLDCALYPFFDEYVCSCHGDASLCPTDCFEGRVPYQKSHYWTQCKGIPNDQPNYVLNEHQKGLHCAENAVVSSWCDEAVDNNLECKLFPKLDEYICRCDGHAHCPTDCVDGKTPQESSPFMTHCKGIPLDQPNYVLTVEH